MSKKLLFVVTEDWYFVSHRLPLAVAALKQGYDVAVAAREGKMADVIRDHGIRFIPFSLSRRIGNPLREITALCRLYQKERPDIVHHVAMKPVLFGSLARWLVRVPSQVNAVAGLGWLFTSPRRSIALVRPVVRNVLAMLLNRSGSLTIVQNPEDYALLNRSGVHTRRLKLIPGAGVDTESFHPATPSPAPVRVMLVARMLRDKGVGEFAEAARILSAQGVQASFILVGDPDPANPSSVSEAELKHWSGQHGIEWWGRRDDMVQVWQSAHIACLPSYREGMPKSLLEAAACGLPIVTTDVPGCKDVVEPEVQGLLVPARDPLSLAQAIGRLVADEPARKRMGENSRRRALDEFSQERIIAQTLETYEMVLAL